MIDAGKHENQPSKSSFYLVLSPRTIINKNLLNCFKILLFFIIFCYLFFLKQNINQVKFHLFYKAYTIYHNFSMKTNFLVLPYRPLYFLRNLISQTIIGHNTYNS